MTEVGLAALKEAHDIFEHPVMPPAAIDAMLDQSSKSLTRIVKEQERSVLEYRTKIFSRNAAMDQVFAPLFATGDRDIYINLRMLVAPQMLQTKALHEHAYQRFAHQKLRLREAIVGAGRTSEESRFIRKMTARMIASVEETEKIGLIYERHLEVDILGRIDTWLRYNPAPKRSPKNALPQMLSRYPVVADYLAR